MTLLYVASDLDGTVTNANVSFAFGRFLFHRGEISFLQAFTACALYSFHFVGLLSVERLHEFVFDSIFRGRSRCEIEALADAFFAASWARLVKTWVVDEIRRMQRLGARIAFLSSSPDFLVDRAARILGVEEVHATRYIADRTGRYSALGAVCTGAAKARVLKPLHGQYHVIAFSDNLADAEFLEQADESIVVSPGRRLRWLASAKGWKIIR